MSTPSPTPATDAELGMAWWNGLTARERREWMARAGDTGVAADAWELFKRGADYDSPEAQARREAYYNKLCWCGHAMGNHTQVSGECMLCDHATTAKAIRDHEDRMRRV